MRFAVPGTMREFEVPDEWWRSAGMEGFVASAEHYDTDLSTCSEVVAFEEVEPPLRDDCFWFRNRDSVIDVLRKISSGQKLEPVEVWSRAKTNSTKLIVRDGFHRFYLSVAAGYRKVPVRITDFDINALFEKERRGAVP
jgi:hypothetical protein